MTTQELLKDKQEQRAAALAEVRSFGEKVEKQTWKDETDAPALDAAQARVSKLDNEIKALQAKVEADEMEARANSQTPPAAAPGIITKRGDSKDDAIKGFMLTKAVRELSRPGGSLSGLEAEMCQEAEKEARAAGVEIVGNMQLPNWLVTAGSTMGKRGDRERRDMTTSVAEGGYGIQTDVGELIPLLDPMPILRRLGARFMTGLIGNLDLPRVSGGATAAWETEQADANETTPTFDRVQLAPNRLAAWTDISKQLQIQATFTAENVAREELNQSIANALDVAAFSGNGGNIAGLLAESGLNTVTFQSAATWAKLVEMETLVASDDANMGTLAYLFTPAVMGALKTKERTSANGIYLAQGRNQGVNEVNGYPAFVSSLVPTSGGTGYGFYGNWRDMLVGQWGGLDIQVDPYTQNIRGTTRIVTNSYWDVAVRHGQSFSVGVGIHPS